MLTSTGMILPCIFDRYHFKFWSTLNKRLTLFRIYEVILLSGEMF